MAQYLVGFDRFIALEWANFALELSLHAKSDLANVSDLKNWLGLKIPGKDAPRKTANVLTRLWLESNPEIQYFRNKARKVSLDTRKNDYVLFHWGMALLVFPFFRETCIQIGRLAALQSSINRKAIHLRVAEKYSNQGTVPRSVDRIFQTLLDWKLIKKTSQQEYVTVPYGTTDSNVKKWLLEAITFSTPSKRVPLNDFYRLPELFPFEFNGETRQLILDSTQMKIERDGNNSEYVVWTANLN